MLANRFYPILIAMILTVWGGACRGPVIDAPDESSITVYTPLESEYTKETIDAFHVEYPDIKVELVPHAGAVLVDRLIAEQEKPEADVIWGIELTHAMFAEWRDLLKTYSPDGIDRIDHRFRDSHNPPYWVGIAGWIVAVCVNTDKMEQLGLPSLPEPASWKDLLKSDYKGYLVMPSPVTDHTGYLAVSAILQIYGEAEGWAYLTDLHNNIGKYSVDQPSQLVGTGDYPIGICDGYEGTIERSKGNPVEMVFPDEGTGWDLEVIALIHKESINPSAKLFLDWAISDEALKRLAKTRVVTSVTTNQPRPDGFPEDLHDRNMLDQDIPWMTANHKRIVKKWKSRYEDNSKSSN